MLPTSYKISSHLDIDPEPFASGGSGDVFRGTLGDSEVCIKRVRVYIKLGTKKAARVGFLYSILSYPPFTSADEPRRPFAKRR